MKKGVYEIRQLTIADITDISSIHLKAFKDSALTKLGFEPIRRYYTSLLERSSQNCNIGAYENGNRLLGYCFSGYYSGSFTSFITQNKNFLFFWMLIHPWFLLNPVILERVKTSLQIFTKTHKSKQNHPRLNTKSFGILATAVDPTYQGMGIGKKLTEHVEDFAIEHGYQHIHLTVHLNNIQSIRLHESLGYQKLVSEDKTWHGLMTKKLTVKSLETIKK